MGIVRGGMSRASAGAYVGDGARPEVLRSLMEACARLSDTGLAAQYTVDQEPHHTMHYLFHSVMEPEGFVPSCDRWPVI